MICKAFEEYKDFGKEPVKSETPKLQEFPTLMFMLMKMILLIRRTKKSEE
jgi:hypothetical protein